MFDFGLAAPWFLLLLIALPFLWKRYQSSENLRFSKMKVPSLPNSRGIPASGRVRWRKVPVILRITALVLLIFALARPQKPLGTTPLSTEGIDIMLSLDISSSMLAQDFKPDRLQAALEVAKDFIRKRSNDRIGMVIFAGESFTQCPLTTDHQVLLHLLENVNIKMLEDGTAIGMGLATAVNRLRQSESKSKVVILMTDGVNNSGYIDPQTAMEMAINDKVKVYTIGIGRTGVAPYPVSDPYTGRTVLREMEVQIDEELMQQIAAGTGGRYYRAEENRQLENIYKTIDELERSEIKMTGYTPKEELFLPFVVLALMLLLMEWIFRTTYLQQNF
jgi:Ca-activated chloride channel family protein